MALGIALDAVCVEFFKDVPGVFNKDPKKDPDAKLIEYLTYSDVLNIVSDGSRILHPRCVELAMKNGLPLHVCSFKDNGEKKGTVIQQPEHPRSSVSSYQSEM